MVILTIWYLYITYVDVYHTVKLQPSCLQCVQRMCISQLRFMYNFYWYVLMFIYQHIFWFTLCKILSIYLYVYIFMINVYSAFFHLFHTLCALIPLGLLLHWQEFMEMMRGRSMSMSMETTTPRTKAGIQVASGHFSLSAMGELPWWIGKSW